MRRIGGTWNRGGPRRVLGAFGFRDARGPAIFRTRGDGAAAPAAGRGTPPHAQRCRCRRPGGGDGRARLAQARHAGSRNGAARVAVPDPPSHFRERLPACAGATADGKPGRGGRGGGPAVLAVRAAAPALPALVYSTPEQAFVDKLLREDIECALAELPEHHRAVVLLADVEEFGYAEIAQMLDIPLGTVRSRLARARSALQKLLWKQAQDHGLRGGAAVRRDESVDGRLL